MSKLSNHQIKAQCRGLEQAIKFSTGAARTRRLKRLAEYHAELAEREAAGVAPRAYQIQEAHLGKSRQQTDKKRRAPAIALDPDKGPKPAGVSKHTNNEASRG